MSTKKPADDEPAKSMVHVSRPDDLQGTSKQLGGSQSDHWNTILANQALSTLWTTHSKPETLNQQHSATLEALCGIGPRDEIEGMIAAQLLAAHSAAIECYRRAMIGEQTFEGRQENLNQANKLSRTYAALLDALNRHRGKGQQKVTVEHVHVHAGGQALVGTVETPGGGGSTETVVSTPCKANYPCTSARDAERGQGARRLANLPRCRTADAACTAESRGALRRAIGTPSSMGGTRPRRLQLGARSPRSCAP
jgi:hypothetical protein